MLLFHYDQDAAADEQQARFQGIGVHIDGVDFDLSRAVRALSHIHPERLKTDAWFYELEHALTGLENLENPVDEMRRLVYEDLQNAIEFLRGTANTFGAAFRLSASHSYRRPVEFPGKILALVRNYRKHAEEFGAKPPDRVHFFPKFPSIVIAHKEAIRIPAWLDGRIDHEVELGVIIGRTCKGVSEADALEYVAGYTIVNDVSARRVQKACMEANMPWAPAKNFDTFCPMGPYFVPREAVPDPQKLGIACRVNGEMRQQGNTTDMVFPVRRIIAEISHGLTLEPGDVIATGTPEGVGAINPGDVVQCEIEGLGVLENPVTREA